MVFRQYVLGKLDYAFGAEQRGVSRQELSGRFTWFMSSPPSPQLIFRVFPPKCLTSHSPWAYGYDGKWLGRSPILLVHRDVTHKETLWWSIAKSENIAAVKTDIKSLARYLSVNLPVGAVTDGKPGIGEVIKEEFILEFYQRCLVHIVRDLKNYLPRRSPLSATRALRSIAISLTLVDTEENVREYFRQLQTWHEVFGAYLKEKSHPYPGSNSKRRWWYTHGNIRRAWRLMTTHPDTLFGFLTNPLIPKTNNSLEGVNRHLKRRAGMQKGKQLSLMIWKLIFSRIKTDRQLRKLWVNWKPCLRP